MSERPFEIHLLVGWISRVPDGEGRGTHGSGVILFTRCNPKTPDGAGLGFPMHSRWVVSKRTYILGEDQGKEVILVLASVHKLQSFSD